MSSPAAFLESHANGVVLRVKVVPRSSRNQICEQLGDRLKIKIAAPPVDSAANDELIRFLAKHLAVPRSNVQLIKGQTSRTKDVLIHELTVNEAANALST